MRDAFGARTNVREKGPGDWVSDVDTASERAVRDGARTTPRPRSRSSARRTAASAADVGWFVDPLDGTANFLHGFPVGRRVGRARGRRRAGRRRGRTRRCSATCTRRAGAGERSATASRIRVSERAPRAARSAPPGSRSARSASASTSTSRCSSGRCATFEDLRRAGAASLDLAWTAAGVFDGYFEQNLGTWDVAAGALLVREAGGVVTDWQGDERAWLTSGDIVAGPPAVHARILEIIAASRCEPACYVEHGDRSSGRSVRRKRARSSPSAV